MLGLFKNWDCAIAECQLFAGDTDGMTEAFDEAGCEFGEERLATALCRNKTLPAPALLGAVLQEVQRFSPQEQHDDITLLVAKCSGAADLQGKLY